MNEAQPIRIVLPAGIEMGTVNAYLFTDPEPVLVDTGIKSPESWAALQEGLAESGLTVLDLSRVVITHTHVDHDGQAGTILANSDADVWISEAGAPWLLDVEERHAQRVRYYEQEFLPATGLPAAMREMIVQGWSALSAQRDAVPAERICTFRTDGVLQMGGRPWQVVFTPGHASMQTCFFQHETGQLLSADMLLAITPVPVVESPPPGQSARELALPRFMASLELVESLDADLVLPGHGRPFRQHRAVIQRQRERILERKGECLAWIKSGLSTPADLLEKMYGHRPVHLRFAGLWMLIGYLDLLLIDDLIEQQTIDGVWHYTPQG